MLRTTRLARAVALALLLAAGLAAAPAFSAEPPSGVVNVNTATLEELQRLPGIGESRAREVIATREARGGAFESVDELLEVKGIGAKSLERLRPYVVLEGKTTAAAD